MKTRPYYTKNHRPYSRQVTEQLLLSGSVHSHQLVYLKASNIASSENHWLFIDWFWCTLSLYIALLLWSVPSLHVDQLYHGVSRENEKQKRYIWPIFTCIDRTFYTGNPIHVNWNRHYCARAIVSISLNISPYPMNVPGLVDKKIQ